MEAPSKEKLVELEALHAATDEAYEAHVLALAAFEAAKTKFSRTLRSVKISCGVPDEWGLDYVAGTWTPPKLQIPQ